MAPHRRQHTSVADRIAVTARVISAAALIMVFVFGAFQFEPNRVVKLMGTGLATVVAPRLFRPYGAAEQRLATPQGLATCRLRLRLPWRSSRGSRRGR